MCAWYRDRTDVKQNGINMRHLSRKLSEGRLLWKCLTFSNLGHSLLLGDTFSYSTSQNAVYRDALYFMISSDRFIFGGWVTLRQRCTRDSRELFQRPTVSIRRHVPSSSGIREYIIHFCPKRSFLINRCVYPRISHLVVRRIVGFVRWVKASVVSSTIIRNIPIDAACRRRYYALAGNADSAFWFCRGGDRLS